MSNTLDEALADVAALAWDRGALLPPADRLREAVMAAVVADRARRPALAARAKLRHPGPVLDQIRETREWMQAEPEMTVVAARHGFGVDVFLGRRKDGRAVAARDELKWSLLQQGMAAREIGRVLDCSGGNVTKGSDRHVARRNDVRRAVGGHRG